MYVVSILMYKALIMFTMLIFSLLLLFAVVKGQNICELNSSTVFNCSDVASICQNYTTIIAAPDTNYQCLEPLVLSAQNLSISGNYSGLEISGNEISVYNITVLSDLTIGTTQNLQVSGQILITGSLLIKNLNITNQSSSYNILNYGNTSAIITPFDLSASKLIVLGIENITIMQSNIELTFPLCVYQSINVNYLSNKVTQYTYNMDVKAVSRLNFSLFLLSANQLSIEQTSVVAASIMAISLGNISIQGSNLNTTAQSCKTNSGMGRGTTIQYQNSYCTSGSSSCGYGTLSNPTTCINITQYFLFLSHSFPYMSKGPKLSTGSGGYGYSSVKTNNGAGGGIVFILAYETTKIDDSKIQASGGDVVPGDFLSAGSGGTIFITSNTLICQNMSYVQAMGGNSYNNNGSGGGGVIKISYQNMPANNLRIDISQGIQNGERGFMSNATGIFYGPVCNPGTYVSYLRCLDCNAQNYSSLGDPVWRPCPIIDSLQFNMSSTQSTFLKQCYQQKYSEAITSWATPGDINLLTISLYLAFLIIFTIIGAILKKKIKKEKLSSNEDFKIEDVKKDIEKAKILALELRKSKQIKSHELMYHVHRISCFGNNNEDSPWILPQMVSDDVKKYVHCQVFRNFAESFNQQAKWTKTQYWITKISLVIYPLYWYYLDLVKKRKFKALLQKLEHAKDYNLLKNHGYEDRNIITIKFSKNKDYTNCYLDFFVYERADIRYFNLSSPFLLYLSGEGNFLRPFYLQEGDVFFRMMFFVINRNIAKLNENTDEKSQLFNNMVSQKKRQKNSQQLNKFLRKLNTLACTLDLSGPTSTIVEVLWKLVQFIDFWNRQFFNKMAVHVDLLLMISRLYKGNHVGNDVQVLTSKNQGVFEANILKKLQQYNRFQHTIKIALFVYNPQQEIPKEEEAQIYIKDHQQSSQEDQQSLRQTLLDRRSIAYEEGARSLKWWMRAGAIMSRLRYYMLSHQTPHFDEYTIKFLQSLFILMQMMLVFIWSIKLELPYIFINLVCPFIGIIWFVSDSYGFGKLYLIFNSMALLDEIVALFVYTLVEKELSPNSDIYARNIACTSVNIVIIVVMILIGKRAITLSKKLSLKKEEQPHVKKD